MVQMAQTLTPTTLLSSSSAASITSPPDAMADTDFSCFYAFYRTFQEQANKDNNDYNHLPFPVRLSWFAGRLVDEKHMLVINSIPFLNWITHTPTMTTRTLTFLTILLVDLLC